MSSRQLVPLTLLCVVRLSFRMLENRIDNWNLNYIKCFLNPRPDDFQICLVLKKNDSNTFAD